MPVFFGIGIYCYFALTQEPNWAITGAILTLGLGALLIDNKSALSLVISGAVFWTALGFTISKIRTTYIASPTIQKKTNIISVYGWVETIEKRQPTGVRINLHVHNIKTKKEETYSPQNTPKRVRIAINQKNIKIKIAQFVRLKAILHPPPQPVWPGGFDYGRSLWFSQIGGVGFSISKPQNERTKTELPFSLKIQKNIQTLRRNISTLIKSHLPKRYAALVIALITGDRSEIAPEDLKALRESGLAHILAISGLHMAIMAGTLFWLIRYLLAAIPSIALRYPIKKIAALIALFGGAYYLLLSGAAISTQRAYVMISIMLIAIILNRSAITLRNVALAALVIMIIRPESLNEVGFQMSFAAATGLVAIYEMMARERELKKMSGEIITPSFTIFPQYLKGIISTTLIASIAVAPFAAYHFNKLSQFSLLGNILAMPIVGLIIMPMVLLVLISLPFGLQSWPLKIMEYGLETMMNIAEFVSKLPYATQPIRQIPDISIILMVLGGLWLSIWLQTWRYYGLFLIAIGLAMSPMLRLPDILVDRDGKILAIHKDNGELATPNLRAGKFSLSKWMQIYGDVRPLKQAKKNNIFRCDLQACAAKTKGYLVSYIKHPSAIQQDCRNSEIIITKLRVKQNCPSAKILIDQKQLEWSGAHAIYLYKNKIKVRTVQNERRNRPWGNNNQK